MRLAENFCHMGVDVEIHCDDDEVWTPRDTDNYGVMYCSHRGYVLGDEQFTADDHASIEDVYRYLREERNAVGAILPLFLLDHGGIAMQCGEPIEGELVPGDVASGGRFVGDGWGWDTSWVGFIFAGSESQARIGTPPEHHVEVLRGEVEGYDKFLRGEVYGYVVGRGGRREDSCWGFLGVDAVGEEARAAAEAIAKDLAVAGVAGHGAPSLPC